MKKWALLAVTVATSFGSPTETLAQIKATEQMTPLRLQLAIEGNLPSLGGAGEWLNSPPLGTAELRGKVVLVEFWTYSCINWLRTLPYVRAWAEKYRGHGLVVIGVHSPEFEFEKNVENVRRASRDLRIEYPIAVDSDHAIWRAFGNEYWPALYFVDARGHIRHHQFGEGNYEESERVIQQLLAEAENGVLTRGLVSVEGSGPEAPANWENLLSPETYLGSGHSEGFVSTRGTATVSSHAQIVRLGLRLNQWTLTGEWTRGREHVTISEANGRIIYRFHARDVHLVMGATKAGAAVHFRVLVDGLPPGAAHGSDVDEQGDGSVSEPRLYQLVRQPAPVTDRLFEIEFLGPGVEAFSFTFG